MPGYRDHPSPAHLARNGSSRGAAWLPLLQPKHFPGACPLTGAPHRGRKGKSNAGLPRASKEQGFRTAVRNRGQGTELQGLVDVPDRASENLMNLIYHCDFFIGLGSGSSWLAWVLDKQVVMICNFSEEGHEFTSNCIRITDKSICHGCWNKENIVFSKSEYDWCPFMKNIPQQFECHTSITAEQVIQQIKPLLP